MTKKIYSMCMAVALLVAGVAMSGCKKDNNNPDQPKQVQTYKMSIQASKGTDQQANGPRRVLGLDGTTLNATWAENEEVTVYNTTKGEAMGGTLKAQTSGASTQLTGELTGTIEAGDELTLKYLSANYTGQNGTLTYISANCDYATASVTVETVAGGEITTTADANFENQQAIVKFTLKDAADHTTLLSPTALIFNDGTANIATLTIPDATYTTNGAGVLYVAVPGFSGKDITLTATIGSDTYTYEKASATLSNGQYYILTAEMTKQTAPAYKEYGPFSVSSTQRVNFSQGNLQYTISSGKFEFMTNQYDMVETNNQDIGTDYASQDVISLFGWATSNINTPANTYYYPWETDDSEGNRAKYGSGITSGDVNWATAHANYDWGANTGDLGTGWRTLTKDEWVYLFNTRIVNGGTGNGKSYTVGKSVNGTKGVVLYPDNYIGATYTGSNWSTFEEEGCVFLPVAGLRSGTSVSEVGSEGYYWSSTSNSSENAYIVYFVGGNAEPDATSSFRNSGLSVRLVKNVE